MRNLKKVLSLVLCVAMMLSVMVVGAGAAFSDQSKIKNTEAVDACTALNIIGGYPDGSFKPEGNITRAEVTKMICVALNGGKEPNLATNATPTFSDVRTNANSAWAEKYIESCYAQGIVSGVGGGKFAPAGNVTGTQLAKMLLVSLGYNPDIEKFTGNAWATNVNIIATQKGLYEGLESIDVSAALTRDNAAQMIWNALKAGEVKYEYTLVSENGTLVSKTTLENKKDTDGKDLTMLKDKYNVAIVEKGVLTNISEDDKNTYNVRTTVGNYTKVEKDYSELMGQKVDVLVKDNDPSKVFGIYANEDSKVVATGICDDLDTVSGNNQKVKVDSTEYKTEGALSTIDVYEFNSTSADGKLSAYIDNKTVAPYSIKLIDNNGDGKIDRAVVVPFTVKKVTYVGSSSLTLEGKGSIDKDDAVFAKDLAKDDYVMVVDAAKNSSDKIALTKVTVVTGKVSAVKDSSTVQVDGAWYKAAATTASADILSDADLDSTVELQVVNGFYFASDVTAADASSTNVLYVSAADAAEGSVGDYTVTIKAYFADGTDKKVDVVKVNDKDVDRSSTADFSSNVPDVASYSTSNNKVVAGMMYRYEVKKNGDYKLFALSDATSKDRAGYKTYKTDNDAKFNTTTDRLTSGNTSFTIADNATVFVQAPNAKAGDKVKVISGKALKKWNDFGESGNSIDNVYAQVLANESNGAKNAKVIKLFYTATNGISSASDNTYGFVTSAPVRVPNGDGDKVWQYEIWNGKTTLTVFEDESTQHAAKGDFIKYSVVSDKEIEDVTTLTATYAAVTAIDGKNIDVTAIDGTKYTALEIDTEDTNVIYVDTKNTAKAEGGSIQLADEPTTGNYTMNVFVVRDAGIATGNTLDAIFVDVNNEMKDMKATLSGSSITKEQVNTALKNGDVTVTGTLPAGGISVPANTTLTIAGTVTSGAAVTLDKEGAVVLPNGTKVDAKALKASGALTITETSGGVALTAANDTTITVATAIKLGTKDTKNFVDTDGSTSLNQNVQVGTYKYNGTNWVKQA